MVKDLKRSQHLTHLTNEEIAEIVIERARTEFFNDLKRRVDKVNIFRGEEAYKREIVISLAVNLEAFLRNRVKLLAPEKLGDQDLQELHKLLMSIGCKYNEDINEHRRIKKAVEKLFKPRNKAAHGKDVSLSREEIKEVIEAIEDLWIYLYTT